MLRDGGEKVMIPQIEKKRQDSSIFAIFISLLLVRNTIKSIIQKYTN